MWARKLNVSPEAVVVRSVVWWMAVQPTNNQKIVVLFFSYNFWRGHSAVVCVCKSCYYGAGTEFLHAFVQTWAPLIDSWKKMEKLTFCRLIFFPFMCAYHCLASLHLHVLFSKHMPYWLSLCTRVANSSVIFWVLPFSIEFPLSTGSPPQLWLVYPIWIALSDYSSGLAPAPVFFPSRRWNDNLIMRAWNSIYYVHVCVCRITAK